MQRRSLSFELDLPTCSGRCGTEIDRMSSRQAAIDNYIDAATTSEFGHPVELSDDIRHAVELASMLKDQERRARAIECAAAFAVASLGSDEEMPGVVFRLLEMFIDGRPDRRPPNLDELVEAAVNRFGDDPW